MHGCQVANILSFLTLESLGWQLHILDQELKHLQVVMLDGVLQALKLRIRSPHMAGKELIKRATVL